jgi:hypothetical protein
MVPPPSNVETLPPQAARIVKLWGGMVLAVPTSAMLGKFIFVDNYLIRTHNRIYY